MFFNRMYKLAYIAKEHTSAQNGVHYAGKSENLVFREGETEKTFTVDTIKYQTNIRSYEYTFDFSKHTGIKSIIGFGNSSVISISNALVVPDWSKFMSIKDRSVVKAGTYMYTQGPWKATFKFHGTYFRSFKNHKTGEVKISNFEEIIYPTSSNGIDRIPKAIIFKSDDLDNNWNTIIIRNVEGNFRSLFYLLSW